MKNLKEIKTTIIGLALFGLSFAYFAVNFKGLDELVFSDIYVPTSIGILGILLMLAPDKLLDFAFSWFKKNNTKKPQ